MSNAFDSIQSFGKDNVDTALKAADAVTKGFQTIATEAADYSKRSFEAGTAAFEKLAAAKSVDTVVALQQDFVRTAYRGYVGQVTRFGEIFSDMAKSAAAPYQSLYGKFGK
ncbi:MAG: phasin family protein [Bauldia sp.]